MEFRGQIGAYIGSNAPIMQIVSHEWEVVEGLITKVIRDLGDQREYLKWSNSLGMQLFENECLLNYQMIKNLNSLH